MTTLNTGSARFGTGMVLLKLFLPPSLYRLITLLFYTLCPPKCFCSAQLKMQGKRLPNRNQFEICYVDGTGLSLTELAKA